MRVLSTAQYMSAILWLACWTLGSSASADPGDESPELIIFQTIEEGRGPTSPIVPPWSYPPVFDDEASRRGEQEAARAEQAHYARVRQEQAERAANSAAFDRWQELPLRGSPLRKAYWERKQDVETAAERVVAAATQLAHASKTMQASPPLPSLFDLENKEALEAVRQTAASTVSPAFLERPPEIPSQEPVDYFADATQHPGTHSTLLSGNPHELLTPGQSPYFDALTKLADAQTQARVYVKSLDDHLPERHALLDASDLFLDAADLSFEAGQSEDGEASMGIAWTLLDTAVSTATAVFLPPISVARSVIESISGTNLVTGEKLDDFQRGIELVNALSLGTTKAFSRTFDVLRTIAARGRKSRNLAASGAHTIQRAAEAATARHTGSTLADRLSLADQKFFDLTKAAGKRRSDLISSLPVPLKRRRHALILTKDGGLRAAESDFQNLAADLPISNYRSNDGSIIRSIKMEDGIRVNIRSFSSDARPTIEIQLPGKFIKVRYGN